MNSNEYTIWCWTRRHSYDRHRITYTYYVIIDGYNILGHACSFLENKTKYYYILYYRFGRTHGRHHHISFVTSARQYSIYITATVIAVSMYTAPRPPGAGVQVTGGDTNPTSGDEESRRHADSRYLSISDSIAILNRFPSGSTI